MYDSHDLLYLGLLPSSSIGIHLWSWRSFQKVQRMLQRINLVYLVIGVGNFFFSSHLPSPPVTFPHLPSPLLIFSPLHSPQSLQLSTFQRPWYLKAFFLRYHPLKRLLNSRPMIKKRTSLLRYTLKNLNKPPTKRLFKLLLACLHLPCQCGLRIWSI